MLNFKIHTSTFFSINAERNRSINKGQSGFAALYLAVLILTISLTLTASIFVLTSVQQKNIQNIIQESQSYYSAEAGIEDAIFRIKNSKPISSNYVITVDAGQAAVSISNPNQNTRIVRVKGTRGNVSKTLEAQLSIQSITPEFFYGAQVGDLGLKMENNSWIEGSGGQAGNVYSNGPIAGSEEGGSSVITGNVFVATGMSLGQTHTVYNSDQIFGKANPIIDIAQSFQPSITDALVKVSIYIKKFGSPDDVDVNILTDSADQPSKTVLAHAELEKNLVGTSYGWVDIVFPSPPSLVQGATYWLSIDASIDSKDYWVWGKDSNQGYGNGLAKYVQDWSASSPNWTTIAGDLDFKIYMGGQATFLKDVTVLGDAHANTITSSKICGNAYYQTIDASSLNFLNNPSNPTCPDPLTSGTAYSGSSDPPLQNMPISESNINQWEDEAIAGGVLNGDLTVDSNLSYGPKQINGNLIMTSNNKILTVEGSIYVTGYLNISNGSSIRCSPNYGLNSCVVVVDQWAHFDNNGVFQGSGSSGSYIMILSNSSCDGTFSTNCTHHNASMDLHNGASGAIFYANDGFIYLHNGVVVSELTAKKIQLEPGAIIRYEQGLVNASFSSGPGGSWQVESWKEVE
jgi:hypothetical protein